jgi:hypothetical protein
MRRDARLYHFPLAHAFPSYQHSSDARVHGEIDRAPPAMKLIAYYVVFVLIGETIAYFIGRSVEHWSAPASLPVFLACFFIVFWGAWRLAIRVT